MAQTNRLRIALGGGRTLRIRSVAQAFPPIDSYSYTSTFQSVGLSITGGETPTGVVYDVSSNDVIDVVLIGNDPGSHGLHVDHSPHPPRFFEEVTITAIADGNWSDPDIWDLERVPEAGDVVRVPNTLTFSTAGNRKLVCNLLAVNETGTLVADFSGTNNTCEIVFPDVAIDTELDPYQWGHGLIVLGTATIKGKAKTPWGRLAAEVSAGAGTLTLASAPTNWANGDNLIVPDTRQRPWEVYNEASADHYANVRFDELTVASVASATVTLTGTATYAHGGAKDRDGTVDFFPVAMNLTRNVLIRGAGSDATTRPHLVSHGRATVDIRHVEIRDTGRSLQSPWNNSNGVTPGTNQQGRYGGWHFHHTIGPEGLDPEVPQFRFEGNACWNQFDTAIEDLPRWGITVHGSHYGLVKDNVVFNWSGSGIVTEDGSETENTFTGNCVIGIPPSGTGENSRGAADVAHSGQGFWFAGVENRVLDNFAGVCAKAYSIVPYMLASAHNVRLPSSKGADPHSGDSEDYETVHENFRPLLEFDGNEAGGRLTTGLDIWKLGTADGIGTDNPSQAESVVQDFGVWHVEHSAFYNYMTRHLTFDGLVARNDIAALRLRQGGGICFFASDYVTSDFAIVDSNIQGFLVGWFVNYGHDGMSATGTTWSNYRDIEVRPTWAAGTTAQNVPARDLTLTYTTGGHLDPLCSVFGDYGAQGAIVMDGRVHAYSSNLIHDDIVNVVNWEGGATDYRLYYPEQDGEYVLPQTITSGGLTLLLGSPASGKTNTQNLADHGVCFAGVITPGGTTTLTRCVGDAEEL